METLALVIVILLIVVLPLAASIFGLLAIGSMYGKVESPSGRIKALVAAAAIFLILLLLGGLTSLYAVIAAFTCSP